MSQNDASITEQPSNRIRSCWSWGNPYSLRFLDDPPADPPADPPVDPPPAAPTSPFNPDGTLVENWNAMAPEGYEHLRDDKTLPRIKKFWDLSSSYVNVRKQVPLDKMPRPNENWGDDEWNEFYDAGGRPPTSGDFNITRPEEIPEHMMTPEFINGYQDLFHKIGLNKKQVDIIAKYNNDLLIANIKNQKQAEKDFDAKLWDKLHDEWGRAFDQKEFRCKKAMERGTGEDEGHYQRVHALVQKSPDLIKCFANIEDQFSEHAPFERSTIETPSDLQTQITALEQDPRYTSPDKAVRMPLVNRAFKLREQMNKDKGITG